MNVEVEEMMRDDRCKEYESHVFPSKRHCQWKDSRRPPDCHSYTGIIPAWIPLESSVQHTGWTRLCRRLMSVTTKHLQWDWCNLRLKTSHVLLYWGSHPDRSITVLAAFTHKADMNIHNGSRPQKDYVHSDDAHNRACIINWINQTTCSWLSS